MGSVTDLRRLVHELPGSKGVNDEPFDAALGQNQDELKTNKSPHPNTSFLWQKADEASCVGILASRPKEIDILVLNGIAALAGDSPKPEL
jgi:hypothetical protein